MPLLPRRRSTLTCIYAYIRAEARALFLPLLTFASFFPSAFLGDSPGRPSYPLVRILLTPSGAPRLPLPPRLPPPLPHLVLRVVHADSRSLAPAAASPIERAPRHEGNIRKN